MPLELVPAIKLIEPLVWLSASPDTTEMAPDALSIVDPVRSRALPDSIPAAGEFVLSKTMPPALLRTIVFAESVVAYETPLLTMTLPPTPLALDPLRTLTEPALPFELPVDTLIEPE
jgi:hypothetical protein